MKKLSLNKINLTSLDKSQMSNVNGGFRGGYDSIICQVDSLDYCDSNGCPTVVTCNYSVGCPPPAPTITCSRAIDCLSVNICEAV